MFDIGVGELTLIAIVALVVLGPERLPKAARFAGLWVRRARMQWDSVKQELERELEAEELKRSLQDVQASLREAEGQLRSTQQQVEEGARGFHDQARDLHDELGRDIDIRTSATPVAAPLELPADAPVVLEQGSLQPHAHVPGPSPVIAQAQPVAPAPRQTLVPAPHGSLASAPVSAQGTTAPTTASNGSTQEKAP
ncbi:twin arginine-targeting protein translocase TatB [Xanthomonas vesicatoria ATCC 35937]|uniref:Sec-independent protein translocase protein TatB n=1 Tax=Xanthomonas vesicatoria ATCC 35937 TaxID=925775 RepID=F0BKA9_9XANT|nr:Sec-independent protein translocase protein TatB [Xanthomonas vesicatoria]APP75809.1 twin arginine-targeting protein translocase TatB [Xanthomonas vesicatoria ATCC 35937]EGD07098.1 Sec-independent protein translocase TatB [Xanthomonas vesicatoria ATCC 35937]KTF31316.1 preprotein translocase [Xanthomonas vesicatoria]MCC8598073.1 Sec-independent protein translocase protein TatB [Xanthomonas vesicatoria]MCC8606092.1 Sec-independent protein translocase protein TatB [Xanthomonas vesicatoria]